VIGKLRDRITIEEKTQVEDGSGGFSETWSTFATVWAEVLPTSSAERFFAEKLEMTTTHKVRIRYLAGLSSSMRINLGARVLKIQGIVNLEERDRFLELKCEEGSGS
jgi:SPP1 family predicted phage head-tail adaptor